VRGHLIPETGCGLNIGVWSMRSLLDTETRGEGEGSGELESKTGSLYGTGAGVRGAESSVKGRQIQCPDVQILRSLGTKTVLYPQRNISLLEAAASQPNKCV
jgi:hypothetical protein